MKPCASCGKEYPDIEIVHSKCRDCYRQFLERKEELQKSGYYDNIKRLNNWRLNNNRGNMNWKQKVEKLHKERAK